MFVILLVNICLGREAFSNCEKLISIKIPHGVTRIDNDTFIRCKSLAKIDIPNGVTEIYAGAFARCDGLVSVTIPDSVNVIGYEAFDRCHNLETVTFGKGLTKIYTDAFGCCDNLKDIVLPEIEEFGEHVLGTIWDYFVGANKELLLTTFAKKYSDFVGCNSFIARKIKAKKIRCLN